MIRRPPRPPLFPSPPLSRSIVPGARTPFLMEIPPIRRPQLRNLFKKIRARLSWYVREAVPMFLLGTFILFIADKIGLLEIVDRKSTRLNSSHLVISYAVFCL